LRRVCIAEAGPKSGSIRVTLPALEGRLWAQSPLDVEVGDTKDFAFLFRISAAAHRTDIIGLNVVLGSELAPQHSDGGACLE
jgi:hypothetical protein